jgi:hypothetical protein
MIRFRHALLSLAFLYPGASLADADHRRDFAANLKYMGLTVHTFASHWEYDFALDDKGYVVAQIGIEMDGDFYLNNYFLLRATTGLYKDCFNLWAGGFHLGFRGNLPVGERWEFRIGIGPTVIWRENWWTHVNNYGGSAFYGSKRQTGDLETAFLWWGGNSEIEYRFSQKNAMVLTVIPGGIVYNFSAGWRRHF